MEKSSLGKYLFVLFVALLFGVVWLISSKALANGAQSAKLKVEVLRAGVVQFTSLSPTESTASSLSCFGQQRIDQYYGGDTSKYTSKLKDQAKCVQGNVTAAYYNALIGEANGSASTANFMKNDVEAFLQVLKTKSSIDGLAAAIIPGGDYLPSPYLSAKGVEIMCLKDSVASSSVPEVPIGSSQNISGPSFQHTTPALESQLNGMKKRAEELKKEMDAALADPKNIDPKTGKAKVPIGLVIKLVRMMKKNLEESKGKFIIVSPSTVSSHYPGIAAKGVYSQISFELSKDENGSLINWDEKVPKIVRGLADAIFGVTGSYFKGTVSVDGASAGDAPLPAGFMWGEMVRVANENIARLEKIKSAEEARAVSISKTLEALKARNYDCADSGPVEK
ncbi:MAG: hypothetical protein AAB602_00065 [Patescibacteria group bacterium]